MNTTLTVALATSALLTGACIADYGDEMTAEFGADPAQDVIAEPDFEPSAELVELPSDFADQLPPEFGGQMPREFSGIAADEDADLGGDDASAERVAEFSSYQSGLAEVAKHGVHINSWQSVFNDITAAGYRLAWIDAYNAGSTAYVNAIFRPSNGYAWVARHGMTGSQYQTEFDIRTSQGYRLLHVDSYTQGGQIRYASIFTKQPGTSWVAYHGVSEASHQWLFNYYTSLGYRSVIASVVSSGGNRYVTALFDKSYAGSWVALHAIPSYQYQSTFNSQTAAGRKLHYLDAYVHNGTTYYSAVFKSASYGWWVARHGKSFWAYQTEWNTWTGAGYLTRLVTGHYNGGHYYAGLWTTN
ncbi:MAG: hypothetical protein AAGC55_03705 [Myxococcota bacterium]